MSQERAKQTRRSATEYRLSITSNPESRRSSLSGTVDNGPGAGGKNVRSGAAISPADEGDSIVQEFILPQIREFSDSMITLDANFTQLNFIHESLVDFNESLGSLLYGLMCNSWCVDFPHVSHDIEEELQIARRLDALKEERQSLIEQLNTYKVGSGEKIPQHTSTQPNGFAQPLPPSKTPRQKVFRSRSNNHDDEEENASEASFVSNPIIDAPRGALSRPPQSNNVNKLRRKSILHTIRNSVSSTDFTEDRRGSVTDLQRTRLSLGGGATRIVATSPAKRRMAQPHISHSRVTKPQQHRHSSLESRPPFR
ncbi:related to DASH complex subunit DAM1 [Zygosaccharomyces bailii]|nr:related to DASH complex subunit DAM1 [Zygosaccharomyces bailii ISA1307]SJM85436.1 related to DASH complex subunit DAM1 [Zygosaccharomyces bailii]